MAGLPRARRAHYEAAAVLHVVVLALAYCGAGVDAADIVDLAPTFVSTAQKTRAVYSVDPYYGTALGGTRLSIVGEVRHWLMTPTKFLSAPKKANPRIHSVSMLPCRWVSTECSSVRRDWSAGWLMLTSVVGCQFRLTALSSGFVCIHRSFFAARPHVRTHVRTRAPTRARPHHVSAFDCFATRRGSRPSSSMGPTR